MLDHLAPVNKPKQNKRYSVIIPCAGLGARMKYTGPKALLSLGSETIIERQIRIIQKTFRLSDIIVVCGFNGQKIVDYLTAKELNNVRFVTNTKYETTNIAYSINVGLNETDQNGVIVMNGDLVFNESALICPFGYQSMVLVDDAKSSKMADREVGCTSQNHSLEYIMYDLKPKWCQIVYFHNQELELLKQELNKINSNNKYTFELINEIIKQGGVFSVYHPKNIAITDVDKTEDLNRARDQICK